MRHRSIPFSSHSPERHVFLLVLLLAVFCGAAQAAPTAPAADTSDAVRAQAQKLFVRGMTRAYLNDYERAVRLYERALELAPQEAPILSAMADAQAAQDDVTAALFYAEQARNVAPANIHYYEQLATLHLQAGHEEDAIATYRDLVERFPHNVDARLELGHLLTEANRAQEAVAVFEDVEQQMGGASSRLYMQMLQLYQRLNDNEGVGRVLRELVALRPEEQLFVHLLGQYYMKEGRLDAAIALYEEVLATKPNDLEIGMELAELYREQGRDEAADRLVHRLTRVEGASPNQLVQRARALYRPDRPPQKAAIQQAVQLLEQALEIDPNHEQALQVLGELRYQAGAYAEAGSLLERALEQNPRAPERWALAAAAYLRADQPQQAVRVAEEGLLLFPGQIPLLRAAAHGLLTLNRNQPAIERFEELLARLDESPNASREQRADVLATLGLLYSRLDDTAASDRAYERAIELDPDHSMALNNYAYSLAEQSRELDRAQTMAHRAVEHEPANASYLDTLGWVYFQQKDYTTAERWLRRALDTGDASATVYEHYGDVQEMLGNPETARTYWQQALDRAPDRKVLREKLEALQP